MITTLIGDLLDLRDLMRGEEHGHLLARDVRDERLQHLLGHRRIEARRRLVENQQLGAAAEREQQGQLRARAARQRLHAPLGGSSNAAEVALLEIARASAERTPR